MTQVTSPKLRLEQRRLAIFFDDPCPVTQPTVPGDYEQLRSEEAGDIAAIGAELGVGIQGTDEIRELVPLPEIRVGDDDFKRSLSGFLRIDSFGIDDH